MNTVTPNNLPKLHNAMWPGLVGKGSPGAEPSIGLDTMLELTANAQVNGIKFDGVDLFLFDPHVSIDITDDGIKRLAEQISAKGFVVGSVVAPVWPPTGGGSAMGSDEERQRFVGQVRKACGIARSLRELGVRPYGVVRIDSACGPGDWALDAEGNQARIAQTFAQACDVAEEFGERLAAEGEICWGGMHSWKKMLDLLERVNRPATLGFQADMAHTLLYTLGYNAPEDAILPPDWDWSDPARLDDALNTLTQKLRPWTLDFHVAQNDATVHGSGTHDKTGHHCLPNDPNGKLNIPHHAGFWLRGEDGQPAHALRHICWDGCMFPNEVMMRPQTWNDILAAMIAVRDGHGWHEAAPGAAQPELDFSGPGHEHHETIHELMKPPIEVMAEVKQQPITTKATRKRATPQARPSKKPLKKRARPPAKRPSKAAPGKRAKPPVRRRLKLVKQRVVRRVKPRSRKAIAKRLRARPSRKPKARKATPVKRPPRNMRDRR